MGFRNPITTAVDPAARSAAAAASSAAAAAQTAADGASSAAAAAQSTANAASAAANNITTTQITDQAISTPKLAAGAVTAGTIAAGAVVAGKIDVNAVQAGNIAAGAVVAGKIDANAVQAGNIAAGAVTAGTIAAGAVTAGTIAATAIDGKTITGATITGATLTGGTVTGALVRATGSGDVSETSTNHALQAGPSNGLNIAIDGNEIMARDGSVSPSVAGPLWVHNPRSGFAQETIGTALTRKDYVDGKAAGGFLTITPSAANTPTKGTVAFGKTFASAPVVVATADTAAPGSQVTGVGATNVTTTGCDIYVTRTNTTATGVRWLAYLP